MKFSEIIKANSELGAKLKDQLVQIKVLTNITINQLKPVLELQLRTEGVNASVTIGDYDNILQDSASIEPEDIVLVFWEISNLKSSFVYEIETLNQEEIQVYTEKIKNETGFVFVNLQKAKLVIFNRFSHLIFSYKNIKATAFENFVDDINLYIANNIPANVVLVNTDKIISTVSVTIATDMRGYYTAKSLYTLEFIKAYAAHVKPVVLSLFGKSKKAIVFDCDNTLWKGVVGEDGLGHIGLSENQKNGSYFKEVQLLAKKFAAQGIIVGICSKNNPADVEEVFVTRNDISLPWDDIVIKKINWNDKASNLNAIAKELNIGVDSIVFVDDSDFELNLIRDRIPSVTTVDVPAQLYEYPSLILSLANLFYTKTSSVEDRKRIHMYKDNFEREKEKLAFENIDDYLKSLQMEIELSANNIALMERLAQMTNKTNQFNLTTRRYSESEIATFIRSEDHDVISLKVKDKFGDSGLTGLAILASENNMCKIDTFLMSCRVLGRSIENVFLNQVIRYAREKHNGELIAYYFRTVKNDQVKDFYDKRGFEIISADENEKTYVYNSQLKSEFELPNYINITWKKK